MKKFDRSISLSNNIILAAIFIACLYLASYVTVQPARGQESSRARSKRENLQFFISYKDQQSNEKHSNSKHDTNSSSQQESSNINNLSQNCPPSTDTTQLPESESKLKNIYQYQNDTFVEPQISRYVTPTFYTLRLKLDPTRRKFGGQLMITLEVDSDELDDNLSQSGWRGNRRYLTLNAGPNLTIRKAFYVFNSQGGIQIAASSISHNPKSELLTIDFSPHRITPGQGLLLLVYSGLVNEAQSLGLFVHRSPGFIPAEKLADTALAKEHELATLGLATHMQPTFSRRLFPSWDEPQYRARFSLVVVLPFRGYTTISNMPIKRKSISLSCTGESLQEVEFQTSPSMSTYLLTLIIGRFDYIESSSSNGCKIRAYVYSQHTGLAAFPTPAQVAGPPMGPTATQSTATMTKLASNSSDERNPRKSSARLALHVATKSMDELENLFGVKYPLDKMDIVALREFANGGMENWGATIFHENYMLYDESSLSSGTIQVNGGRFRSKRSVVPLVVAHEMVHQWFGNLVTPSSWNYLWLSEGFAQYFMYELAHRLYPNENYWHIFIEDNRQSAMFEDELMSSSRALESSPPPFEASLKSPSAPDSLAKAQTEPVGVTATAIAKPQNTNESIQQQQQQHQQQQQQIADSLGIFDELTYNKGAVIVRMTSALLGPQNFLKGLHHYLIKHSHGNVESHDLWLALEESSRSLRRADWQLESLMSAWIRQDGYPLLTVRVYEESGNYRLRIIQRRFHLMDLQQLHETQSQIEDPVWQIPLALASELNPSPDPERLTEEWASSRRPQVSAFLVKQPTSNILISKSLVGSWLKLNFNALGHFRVDYETPRPIEANGSLAMQSNGDTSSVSSDPSNQSSPVVVDMLKRLVPAIRAKKVTAFDRLNLVDDLFSMVKSGRKPTSYYLQFLTEAYENETELVVLRFIVDSLKRIKLALITNELAPLVSIRRSKMSTEKPEGDEIASVRRYSENLSPLYDTYVQRLLTAREGFSLDQCKLLLDSGKFTQMGVSKLMAEGVEVNHLVCATLIQFNHPQLLGLAGELVNSESLRITSVPKSIIGSAYEREFRSALYHGALMSMSDIDFDGSSSSSSSSSPSSSSVAAEGTQATTEILPKQRAPNSNSNFAPNSTTNRGEQTEKRRRMATEANKRQRRLSDAFRSLGSAARVEREPNESSEPREALTKQDPFIRLLVAYQMSESSADRYAIASALGSLRSPRRQAQLLKLIQSGQTLRAPDVAAALESLARLGRIERQLIWQIIATQSEAIERRQMLSIFLRSLTFSLTERDSKTSQIYDTLRVLFLKFGADHGKHISQLMEFVRINTRWFERDFSDLAEYLRDFNDHLEGRKDQFNLQLSNSESTRSPVSLWPPRA